MKPTSAASRPIEKQDLAIIGKTIAGKYRVLDLLGKGAFGTVYLVEQTTESSGVKLALKTLPEALSHESHYRERFINEVRLAMRVVNKYLVQVRDVGSTEDGILYYTMDYCAGRPLSSILDREGMLEVRHALRLTRKLLRALAAAHELGVLHRDIKPSNLLVVASEGNRSIRVLDLGIAKDLRAPLGDDASWTGTPAYMPPEQLSGENIGPHSDLYSVGVVLYESLTSVKPYSATSAKEIRRLFETTSPQPPEKFRPEIARYSGLSELMLKAIDLDPARRFQTAAEFIDAIQRVLKHGEPSATAEEIESELDRAAALRAGAAKSGSAARFSGPVSVAHAPERASSERPSRADWKGERRRRHIGLVVGCLLYAIIFGGRLKDLFMARQEREFYVNLTFHTLVFVLCYALFMLINKAFLVRFFQKVGDTVREDFEDLRKK